MYSAAFFDVNGVLLTYEEAISSFLEEFNAALSKDYTFKDYIFLRGVPPLLGNANLLPLMAAYDRKELVSKLNVEHVDKAEEIARGLLAGLEPSLYKQRAYELRSMLKRHTKAIGSKPLFNEKHVPKFDALKEKYLLGIVTNDDPYFVKKHIPFINHFAFVVSAYDVGVKKPHPTIYSRAIQLANTADTTNQAEKGHIQASNVLYVCDGPHDVEGAKKAGFETYAIYSGMGRREWLYQKGAKRIFNNLGEYLDFLLNL